MERRGRSRKACRVKIAGIKASSLRGGQEREVAFEVSTRGADAWAEKSVAEKQFRGHAAEGPHVQGLVEAFIA